MEQYYQAGVAFQDVEDWDKAFTEFEQAIRIDATYKDLQTRLVEVKAKQREALATAQAKAAQATATAQARAEATAAAATVEARMAQATSVAATATTQAGATAQAQEAEAAVTAEAVAQLEAMYQKCLGAMNLGRWAEAQAACDQVFAVDPNYKDVQAKLADIETKLAELHALTPTLMPPMYTPYPTATPYPTYTPYPTQLPSATPTATSLEMPTSTSTPTPTKVPTRTPRPLGILQVGEKWTQGSLAITLTDALVLPNSWRAIRLSFSIVNIADREFMIDILTDNLYVYPDAVGEWQPHSRAPGYNPAHDERDVVLKPGQPFEFEYWFGNRPLPLGVSKFTVHVKNISDVIKDARWEVPIPRP